MGFVCPSLLCFAQAWGPDVLIEEDEGISKTICDNNLIHGLLAQGWVEQWSNLEMVIVVPMHKWEQDVEASISIWKDYYGYWHFHFVNVILWILTLSLSRDKSLIVRLEGKKQCNLRQIKWLNVSFKENYGEFVLHLKASFDQVLLQSID